MARATTMKTLMLISVVTVNNAFIPSCVRYGGRNEALTMSNNAGETPAAETSRSDEVDVLTLGETETPKGSSTDPETISPVSELPKAKAPIKKKTGTAHKEGLMSPAVKVAKVVLGDEKLKNVRGKVISMHSTVIKDFVATSDTAIGRAALTRLFAIADVDGNGRIDKEELAIAVKRLGFTWLEDKQINGIFKRADTDGNGTLEFDEFVQEVPKLLKTNLVKLAKKNGGDLGFLV